jgi:leucyl aminopeptidase (aminopeptidase T)
MKGTDSMRHHLYILIASICLIATSTAWAQTPGESGLKLNAMAERLVKQNAGIHEGDLVMISGRPADQALLEQLALQVSKVGAFPIITVSSTDLGKRMAREVSLQYLNQPSKMDLKMADIVDVVISVEGPNDDTATAGIAPEIMDAINKSGIPAYKRRLDRGVRQVQIGNAIYPTEAKAKLFGISPAELFKLFHDAMNVDYGAMAATAAKVQSVLQKGKMVRITTPNGTDLTMSIGGHRAGVSDGIITPEKQKQGGVASQVWLPAGEVYIAASAAQGKLVFDRLIFEGSEVQNLVVTVKDGKVVQMTGGAGFDRFKAVYDAGGPGKEELSAVDMGINPNVRLPADTNVRTFIAEGMITVGFGDNIWAGGDNNCGAGFGGHLWGGTLKVDEQVVVENGQLKIK